MQLKLLNWRWIGFGAAACAACCATLIAPLTVGAVGGGLFAGTGTAIGLSWDTLICGGVLAAVASFIIAKIAMSRGSAPASASCGVDSECRPESRACVTSPRR